MKLAPLPPSDLHARPLPITSVSQGAVLVRIHWPGRALFFGPVPRARPRNRFDSRNHAFGTCYFAEYTRGAFVETFLREGRVKLVPEAELRQREWSSIEVILPLRLVTCYGPALTSLHTTSAISSGAYSRSRAWSAALYEHPEAPDGLQYRSRHDDDELCIALFDRAASKLSLTDTLPLLDDATGVIEAINAYKVSVRGL